MFVLVLEGADIADSGNFADSCASTDVYELKISRSINGYLLPRGTFVRFTSSHGLVYARIGISIMNIEQARDNVEMEIPDFIFNKHTRDARNP